MSKWDKLLQRIKSLSSSLRFDELKKVLEEYGYIMDAPGGGGSHYTFRKNGTDPITIPKHRTVKRIYVLAVKKVIESEEKNNEKS